MNDTSLLTVRAAEWAATCERERLDHESIPQTSERLMITALYEEFRIQQDVAKVLRMSKRVLNYRLMEYGQRPRDARRRECLRAESANTSSVQEST